MKFDCYLREDEYSESVFFVTTIEAESAEDAGVLFENYCKEKGIVYYSDLLSA